MTKSEFEAGTWELKTLLLGALTRRLKEDAAGESHGCCRVVILRELPQAERRRLAGHIIQQRFPGG